MTYDMALQATIDSNTRTVFIDITTSAEQGLDKKLPAEQKSPVSPKSWTNGPATTKVLDLLLITETFTITGRVSNESKTTLNESLTNSDTTITVADGTTLDPATSNKPGYILIDNELIKYTGKSTNDLTGCVRGYGGTAALTHTSGATIYHPAFHWKEVLRYMVNKGGYVDMYYPVTISGTTITTAKSHNYMVNFKKISFKEIPADEATPSLLEVTMSLIVGTNLVTPS